MEEKTLADYFFILLPYLASIGAAVGSFWQWRQGRKMRLLREQEVAIDNYVSLSTRLTELEQQRKSDFKVITGLQDELFVVRTELAVEKRQRLNLEEEHKALLHDHTSLKLGVALLLRQLKELNFEPVWFPNWFNSEGEH